MTDKNIMITGKPSMAALLAVAATMGVDAPKQKPPELNVPEQADPDVQYVKTDGHGPHSSKLHYSKKQWQAMRKRRKAAQRSRRRNRRG